MIKTTVQTGNITTKELIKIFGHSNYYEKIKELIKAKQLEPVKSSSVSPYGQHNLPDKWRFSEKISDDFKEKINSFSNLDVTWYASARGNKKAKFYQEDNFHRQLNIDFPYLKKLDNFLKQHSLENLKAASENERSLQIFGEEKVFEKKNGKEILKHVNLNKDDFNVYETFEFPSFIAIDKNGTTTVFLENEDPVFDLAKARKEHNITHFLDKNVKYLGYAGGQALNAALRNPYTAYFYSDELNAEKVYVGDIDEEGIKMLFNNQKALPELKPWIAAYEKMLDVAFLEKRFSRLKESNHKNRFKKETIDRFKESFPISYRKLLDKLVEMKDFYIPQEVLTINDLIGD